MSIKTKIKIATMLCASMQTSHMVVVSMLSRINEVFPHAGTTLVQITATIANLMFIPFALLSGRLSVRISKKSIILAGLFIMAAGGLLPLLFHGNIYMLIVFAAVNGMGLGIMTPVVISIVADHFDEAERSRHIGYLASSFCVGGILMSYGGGLLSNTVWSNAYWMYMLLVPVIVLVFLLLPKDQAKTGIVRYKKGNIKLNATVIGISLLAFFFSLCVNTFITNVSMYINELGINDSSLAGLSVAVLLTGGFITGIWFKRISDFFKQYMNVLTLFLCGVALLLLTLTKSIALVFVCGYLMGMGILLFQSQSNRVITTSLESQSVAMGTALFTSLNNLGNFFSPVVITGLSGAFGGITASYRYGLSAFILLITALILFFRVRLFSKKLYDNTN